jgi:transposase
MILQHKFALFQPLYRVLAELRSLGLNLSAGTVTGGLQQLLPLFQPLYEALVEYNRNADHWHADETRWLVFLRRPDKANFTWQMWVFAAARSIVYVLDPTRAHHVPEDHFGNHEGILNVDRYSAYKTMRQVKSGAIILAFCWAHVRRDFLAVLTGWPELTDWAWSWVEDIALLYERNDARLDALTAINPTAAAAMAADHPTAAATAVDHPTATATATDHPTTTATAADRPTAAAAEADCLLREHIAHLVQRRDKELAQPQLRAPQRKVLESLKNHWSGLTVFLDHPEVPLDNNEAERRERVPVIARKNYYGSGALWSGRLAAILFSFFQTLSLWHLDVRAWLTAYLTACAEAGGQAPVDAVAYLPWNMSGKMRQQLSDQPRPAAPANDTS